MSASASISTRSVLVPTPQPLFFWLLLAMIGHFFVVSTMLCLGTIFEHKPPPMIDNAMEVSMMVLPRSTTKVPQREQQAPTAHGDVAKSDTVAPPKESDLTLNKPDVKQTRGDHSNAREDAIRELLKQQALQDLNAPDGKVTRSATDPNSNFDEAIDVQGSSIVSDPDLARYVSQIQKLFMDQFHPLPSITAANPTIACKIKVTFDPTTGNVTGHETVVPSGNASYDGAAERAVEAVSHVPLPPDKYKDKFADGYVIRFHVG